MERADTWHAGDVSTLVLRRDILASLACSSHGDFVTTDEILGDGWRTHTHTHMLAGTSKNSSVLVLLGSRYGRLAGWHVDPQRGDFCLRCSPFFAFWVSLVKDPERTFQISSNDETDDGFFVVSRQHTLLESFLSRFLEHDLIFFSPTFSYIQDQCVIRSRRYIQHVTCVVHLLRKKKQCHFTGR